MRNAELPDSPSNQSETQDSQPADSSIPQSNGRCQITVADNGVGFDEKYLDRIFTPFQRLHGRGEYEGTGMGLAICRKIVERHGGHITARSTPSQGTTFFVMLPITHPEAENTGSAGILDSAETPALPE